MIKFKCNGAERAVDVRPDPPLLWVIRERLGPTGTEFVQTFRTWIESGAAAPE